MGDYNSQAADLVNSVGVAIANWSTAMAVASVRWLIASLGQVRPDVPKLLIWDNAPPHHPKRVLAAAAAAHITIAWLPFRSPELNPLEDLWRLLKAVVAANRVYATLEALAAHAVSWLDACLPDSLLTRCGLRSSKFDWLPT